MRKLIYVASIILGMMLVGSCDKFRKDGTPDLQRVFILYSVGFNDLSSYLEGDIEEMLDRSQGSYVPELSDDKAVFVVSHTPQNYGAFSTETSPVIFRCYSDGSSDKAVRDTLLRMTRDAKLTDRETMTEALSYIHENFPAQQYVMVYSSHGSGWLPAGYYGKNTGETVWSSLSAAPAVVEEIPDGAVPYIRPLPGPPVKSIGQEIRYTSGTKYSYEMTISDFKDAVPMHLDCLVLDACLMGGVETALELSSVTDKLIMSSCEIVADGFNYTDISRNLINNYDPQAVAEKFYKEAMAETGWNQSATVALVNCRNMEMLGAICRTIFETHRDSLALINPEDVQGFFRYNQSYYYDLRDIVVKAGATQSELNEFDGILSQCIAYKAATPNLFNSIKVNTYCGLSMFLPGDRHKELYDFYRSLRWIDATGLVEYIYFHIFAPAF